LQDGFTSALSKEVDLRWGVAASSSVRPGARARDGKLGGVPTVVGDLAADLYLAARLVASVLGAELDDVVEGPLTAVGAPAHDPTNSNGEPRLVRPGARYSHVERRYRMSVGRWRKCQPFPDPAPRITRRAGT
jgi:hypothetical protein